MCGNIFGMVLTLTEISSFGEELMKLSARRSVEVIRELAAKGDPESLAKAERIAKAPGSVKATAMGSQIRDLGMGGEGLATLVATPEGMRVRKLYDPKGISSPEMIARKAEVGARVTDPSIAKFHGARQTPGGGGTAHMMEYVPGASASGAPALPVADAQRRATQHLKSLDVSSPTDIRPGNMVVDSRTGQPRVIDYLPTQADEAVNVRGRVGLTPKGKTLLDSSGDIIPKAMHAQQTTHLKQRFMRPGGAIVPEAKRVPAPPQGLAQGSQPVSMPQRAAQPTRATMPTRPETSGSLRASSTTAPTRPTTAGPMIMKKPPAPVGKPGGLARKALGVARRVL